MGGYLLSRRLFQRKAFRQCLFCSLAAAPLTVLPTPIPLPAFLTPCLPVQVAVAIVQRCEADLLRMEDFEEMVRAVC